MKLIIDYRVDKTLDADSTREVMCTSLVKDDGSILDAGQLTLGETIECVIDFSRKLIHAYIRPPNFTEKGFTHVRVCKQCGVRKEGGQGFTFNNLVSWDKCNSPGCPVK